MIKRIFRHSKINHEKTKGNQPETDDIKETHSFSKIYFSYLYPNKPLVNKDTWVLWYPASEFAQQGEKKKTSASNSCCIKQAFAAESINHSFKATISRVGPQPNFFLCLYALCCREVGNGVLNTTAIRIFKIQVSKWLTFNLTLCFSHRCLNLPLTS